MHRKTLACLLAASLVPLCAAADDTLVKFRGGIGVQPISAAQGTAPTATTVNRNIVRGVQPPGQPWVISDLHAQVDRSGHITVDGRGLLFAGGNAVGTPGGLSVFASLICESAPPFVERNTSLAGVKIGPDGDFRIDDVLTPPPADCASPVLLIRNTANLAWFAAGIARE